MHDALPSLAGIVAGGVLAQWVAWRLRLPSILVLLLGGVLAGPVLDLLDPDELFGDLLFAGVALAVAVILFEGSLSLDLHQLRIAGRAARNLVSVGVAVTFALAGVAARLVLDLDWGIALLVAAVLVVTGPTVIGPLLRLVRPTGPVGPVLRTEGILVDPLGATLALVVFQVLVAQRTEEAVGAVVTTVVRTVAVGVPVGLAAAALVAVLLRRFLIPDVLQAPAAVGVALAVFALSDELQAESGLLTVTVMGLALGTQRRVSVERILEFGETVQVLLLSGLFIVLAARLELEPLRDGLPRELVFLAVLVLLVRPVAALLSLARTSLSRQERLFVAFVAPRGIVAAAVATVFAIRLDEAGIAGGQQLTVTLVIAIVGTITIYGLGAAPLARRLGLAERNPQGVLLLGADPWAIGLAEALQRADVRTLVVDKDPTKLRAARLAGVDTHFGSILAESTRLTVPLDGIGHFLALTSSDETNALAARLLRPALDTKHVYQLPPAEGDGASARLTFPEQLSARRLFGSEATWDELERRWHRGARIRATKLSDEFTYDDYLAHHGDVLPLVTLADGTVSPVLADAAARFDAGDTVIALVAGDEAGPL